jgi:hypothetical protein
MNDLQINLVVMIICYIYIFGVILIVGKLNREGLYPKSSRKLLHFMIGVLPFIMPLFTQRVFPFLVAGPFVILTFLVTPYSPYPGITEKLSVLKEITEKGHQIGLVLYSLSYTMLAYFFGTKPYVMRAFLSSLVSIVIGVYYFELVYGFTVLERISSILVVSLIVSLVEMVTPRGFDNLTVPAMGVLTYLIVEGGV